jgi:hypothetical protein
LGFRKIIRKRSEGWFSEFFAKPGATVVAKRGLEVAIYSKSDGNCRIVLSCVAAECNVDPALAAVIRGGYLRHRQRCRLAAYREEVRHEMTIPTAAEVRIAHGLSERRFFKCIVEEIPFLLYMEGKV